MDGKLKIARPHKNPAQDVNEASEDCPYMDRSIVENLNSAERVPRVGGYHKLGKLQCRVFHDTSRRDCKTNPEVANTIFLVVFCHYRWFCTVVLMYMVSCLLSSPLVQTNPPSTDKFGVGVPPTSAFSLFLFVCHSLCLPLPFSFSPSRFSLPLPLPFIVPPLSVLPPHPPSYSYSFPSFPLFLFPYPSSFSCFPFTFVCISTRTRSPTSSHIHIVLHILHHHCCFFPKRTRWRVQRRL